MRRLLVLVCFLSAMTMPVLGQEPQKLDLVLIPRDVAAAALNWLAEPNAAIAVKLYSALQACIQDNPSGGTVTRAGADQCPAVTAAIEAREKQLADLQKQLADAKKPAQETK